MSAIQFITSGGMASVGGDLPESDQQLINDLIKGLSHKIRDLGRRSALPASSLSVLQASHLYVGKDNVNYHICFIAGPPGTNIQYIDWSKHGAVHLDEIRHQFSIEVGDPILCFSIPHQIALEGYDAKIISVAEQYVNNEMQLQQKQSARKQSLNVPSAIAEAVENFYKDYSSVKTAFILMSFTKSKLHDEILNTIKALLKTYNITALRADDKEYSDDLFSNIRTYMHATDFGIAVFERISQDNFNPNVSLEVGYMLGLGKDVMLLKDETLKNLHSDLVGRLYRPFDTQDIVTSIPTQMEKWLKDKGYV